LFLRFESTRERIALPYALLLKLELSLDQRTLELGFATHAVTIGGRELHEIYEAVADGHARCIVLSDRVTQRVAMQRDRGTVVAEIRIMRLDPENQKRR
jgi:hypothetical protein